MQRLITVGFGYGDIILKARRIGRERFVHDAHADITLLAAFHNQTKPHDIFHLGEGNEFFFHFFVNAVKIFFAFCHLCFNTARRQVIANFFFQAVNALAISGAGILQRPFLKYDSGKDANGEKPDFAIHLARWKTPADC